MKLPKSFTTVTPFSKAFALFIFIVLPIAAFYFGRWLKTPDVVQLQKTQQVIPQPTTKQDCGKIPKIVSDFIPDDQEKNILGNADANPVWSNDCRYIAFNIFNPSYHPASSKMYLYRTQNQKIEEIKPPTGINGNVTSYGQWTQASCIETAIPVEGITGLVRVFYNPGDGYFSSC